MAAKLPIPQPRSIGYCLERRRLEHRAERIEQVLAALRARARTRGPMGEHVPAPLAQALHGFEAELAAVRDRLQRI
jgi:hypothetical protein